MYRANGTVTFVNNIRSTSSYVEVVKSDFHTGSDSMLFLWVQVLVGLLWLDFTSLACSPLGADFATEDLNIAVGW
jgi:hypothetical protein